MHLKQALSSLSLACAHLVVVWSWMLLCGTMDVAVGRLHPTEHAEASAYVCSQPAATAIFSVPTNSSRACRWALNVDKARTVAWHTNRYVYLNMTGSHRYNTVASGLAGLPH